MRIHYKGALTILRPFGFLKNKSIKIGETEINTILARQCECVLVSLRDVIYFDKQWLMQTVTMLQDIAARTGLSVGICDYTTYKHQIILKNLGVIVAFSLFESHKEAALFFGRVSSAKLAKEVLLFNNNVQKRELIQRRLADRGYECVVCKNFREFIQKRSEYKYAVGSWTTLNIAKKIIETFNHDDIIVYKISGLIDSEFNLEFDMEYHKSLMASGFKFFALIVDAASITNILGANFLVSLAKISATRGASLAICGINKSSVPAGIISLLQEAEILLFNSFNDFIKYNENSYPTGKTYESGQTGITKLIVEYLPNIIEINLNTLSVVSNLIVCRGDVGLRSYDIYEGYICGSIAFYGAINFKIMLSLPPSIASIIKDRFNDEMEDSIVEFMNVIGLNILKYFLSMGVDIKSSMPKVFILQKEVDTGSTGACVDLEVGGEKALLFIAR
ncbi:hypothetical protein [Campylobacter sp. 19-13652]|uniref:hypothetical protein n=1 Tax=Campylobacter sp. 19-13652 TaxID=2840180 RepID=UPI001C75FF30|nr:hypothetical protein [Campylobacter sp. 19-13652]BCX79569.1 hypothetical protein LBC_10310 [Campylobacter sp. 19-13652]